MAEIIEGVINCAIDFKPCIKVERQADGTSALEPYDGITGVTLAICAVRGDPTPIAVSLEQQAAEKADEPGTIYPDPAFDVNDLQAVLLPDYRGRVVYLHVIKDDEILQEPFALLVQKDRLGT